MTSMPKQFMAYVSAFPEGTRLYSKALLHSKTWAASDQAQSRLVKNERLM